MPGLGARNNIIDFYIGVKIVIVVSYGVLDKMAGKLEFGFVGLFISQFPVLVFCRFFEVIFNTQLPETFQGNYDQDQRN